MYESYCEPGGFGRYVLVHREREGGRGGGRERERRGDGGVGVIFGVCVCVCMCLSTTAKSMDGRNGKNGKIQQEIRGLV